MYMIGIDLGGTNLKGGLCDEDGNLIKKLSIPTKSSTNSDELTDDMALLCNKLIESAGIPHEEVESVGIAVPGTADLKKGEIVYCDNVPFLHYPIIEEFSKRFPGCSVYIENDANAAALGEAMCGGAKGYNDMVLITLGTGVGSGIIIGGKIFSGFNYAGAELGHLVVNINGRPCGCGRRGCWEAYSSARGLIRTTKEAMLRHKDSVMWDICGGDIDKVDGQTAFRAADKGDKAAKWVVKTYIKYLACGIINTINALEPEILCIGGGVSNEGDNLLKPLIKAVEKEQYSRYSDKTTEIRLAKLGNDAGVIGAAMLGKQN